MTGRVKDYDRKFRIVVDQDSTTAVKGENYLEFDEWQTIKGGWSYADVPVTVKKQETNMSIQVICPARRLLM